MDYNYITNTGVIVPDTASVKADVENEFKAIFGDDLILDPETPQGRLIAATVSERMSVLRNNAAIANQINPNISGGIFLDSIWAMSGGGRRAATRSTVQITSTGVVATRVPKGSRVEDDNGVIWRSVNEFVIPSSGVIGSQFECEALGATVASAGTITKIFDAVLGWETVNNSTPATVGLDVESDQRSRRRRRAELAFQGQAESESIIAQVSALEGVNSVAYRENVEDTTQVIDGITLVAHSFWVCVDGGANTDIAAAIMRVKNGGSNWNGSVTQSFTDPFSKQDYDVKFERPTQTPVSVRVTVRVTSGTNPVDDVRNAIMDYVNGNIGDEEGFVIGADVSPFELAGAVNSQLSGSFIREVEVALGSGGGGSFGKDTIVIAIDQIATLLRDDIEVVLV